MKNTPRILCEIELFIYANLVKVAQPSLWTSKLLRNFELSTLYQLTHIFCATPRNPALSPPPQTCKHSTKSLLSKARCHCCHLSRPFLLLLRLQKTDGRSKTTKHHCHTKHGTSQYRKNNLSSCASIPHCLRNKDLQPTRNRPDNAGEASTLRMLLNLENAFANLTFVLKAILYVRDKAISS